MNRYFYVYVIKDINSGRFYVGYTSNLLKRIKEHNRGKTRSLRNRGPFELVYSEIYETRHEAYKKEQEIKKFKSGIKFKKLINKPG